MDESRNEIAEIAANVHNISIIKAHLVDKDLVDLELRLNNRIDEVKSDLNKRIDQLDERINRLQRNLIAFIGTGLAIATLVIKYL